MLFVNVCRQTPVFPIDFQMQIISLSAGGTVVVGDIVVSPVTAVIEVMRSNTTLSGITGKTK